MSQIVIPRDLWERLGDRINMGCSVTIPVKVDWPELRLTEGQMMANAVAMSAGHARPYPDKSIFNVVIPYPRELLGRLRSSDG